MTYLIAMTLSILEGHFPIASRIVWDLFGTPTLLMAWTVTRPPLHLQSNMIQVGFVVQVAKTPI